MTPATPFKPPHTLLLATDLSARCDRALDRAVQLARQWNARLVTLTVLDPGTLSAERVRATPLPSWASGPSDPVKSAFERLRRDASAPELDIVPRVIEGKVGETLVQVAAEEGAELIITGVARSESLGRSLLGSTVDWLARHANLPILVVRERARAPYRNIVVASDFSPSSGTALHLASQLFPEAKSTLFHAFDVSFQGVPDTQHDAAVQQAQDAAAAEGRRFLESSGLSPAQQEQLRLVVEQGEPVRLTYEFARDHHCDLIALGTHGRSALFDILIGSIAQRILETAITDVLLVRNPADD